MAVFSVSAFTFFDRLFFAPAGKASLRSRRKIARNACGRIKSGRTVLLRLRKFSESKRFAAFLKTAICVYTLPMNLANPEDLF
ncbi:MAG: hypothetical protein HYW09_01660 [Candidatus Niyogibacteria bacterium]|nr:hypothetical protein [Candidatus Niyogibacteria bacterium]